MLRPAKDQAQQLVSATAATDIRCAFELRSSDFFVTDPSLAKAPVITTLATTIATLATRVWSAVSVSSGRSGLSRSVLKFSERRLRSSLYATC